MVESAGLSFPWIERGRGAADNYARAGRTERDWAGAGWRVGRGAHRRIAGGGRALWRRAVLHAGPGHWIFEESGPGAESVGKSGAGRYGAGDTDLPAARGAPRLGRGASDLRTRPPSGERNFDAAGGDGGG